MRAALLLMAACEIQSALVFPEEGDGGAPADAAADAPRPRDGGEEPDAEPGCRAETCNGRDDDCDGLVDEGAMGTGVACGTDEGECRQGTVACRNGEMVCDDEIGPAFEECDGRDNDCDGETDEVYDFENDALHCGGCDPCDLANATPVCVEGACAIGDCDAGFIDFDGVAGSGCEYPCGPIGPEVCDGVDNDCDGLLDDADPDFVALDENPCVQIGACAGAVPACGGAESWVCTYPPGVCPGCAEICDGVDNDCDAVVDDGFGVGGTCTDGELGVCQGVGTLVCAAGGAGVTCVIADPGGVASAETCNGLDDDCDGETDEPAEAADEVVAVAGFYVYAYEASRPDATAAAPGALLARACSRPSVLPWANVDVATAQAACAAAGKHLCTAAEWAAACGAAAYPYGGAYEPDACNGADYDAAGALPTGSLAGCASAEGALDLSGNLKEWTDDPYSDGAPPDPDGYRVRGGAYDNIAAGLRCDFDFTVLPLEFSFDNLGFRCCCTPGVDAVCP